MRTQAWQQRQQSLSYEDTCAMLTKLKAEQPFLAEVSAVILQQSLRNLNAGFGNFFAKRAQYPHFKSKDAHQSVRYTKNAFTLKGQSLTLAKHNEPLNIVWSRPLPDDAQLVSVTVSKDRARRYFISVLVRTEVRPLPTVEAQVGIDVGIKTLATLSNGQKLENPRHLLSKERRLKLRQRRLSRKVKGSNNRHKALGAASGQGAIVQGRAGRRCPPLNRSASRRTAQHEHFDGALTCPNGRAAERSMRRGAAAQCWQRLQNAARNCHAAHRTKFITAPLPPAAASTRTNR